MLHGCVPYGNAKARMNAFGLPGPIPIHREPIYTPRVELVGKYPTLPDAKQFNRTSAFSAQRAAIAKGIAKGFPLVLSSGRLVEYEGGEETRCGSSAAAIIGMLVLLVVFYLARGMVLLVSGHSGRTIVCFNAADRFVH